MPDSSTLNTGEASAARGRDVVGSAIPDAVTLASVLERVRSADVVLDLRCGDGERCFALASALGPEARVIGIDTDERALGTARARVAETPSAVRAQIRFARVDVRELAEDLEESARYLARNPVLDAESLRDFENWRESRRDGAPALAAASVDFAVALGGLRQLQRQTDRRRTLDQLYAVLKPGGRLVLSDVVSDEVVSPTPREQREILNAGLAGTFSEGELSATLRSAGFVCPRYLAWQRTPSRTVEGVEFRMIGLLAVKPTGTECIDRGDAVIYRGPFAQTVDDEGHIFYRGERMAVCERTFAFLTQGPLRNDFIPVPGVPGREPVAWCAPPGTKRSPKESKSASTAAACAPGSGCC